MNVNVFNRQKAVFNGSKTKEENRMRLIRRLLYLDLYSTDPKESADFFREMFDWEISEGEEGQLYVSVDKYHHRLAFYPADEPGIRTITWEVFNRMDYLKIAKRLEETNTDFTILSPEESKSRQVKQCLYFYDPAGYRVEIAYGPYVTQPQLKNRGIIDVMDMVHVTLAVKEEKFKRNVEFYEEVLGFHISDWVGDKIVFTRCSENHHNLAMSAVEEVTRSFRHVMFEVETIDDLMKMYYRAKQLNKDVRGPNRHGNCKTMEIYTRIPGLEGDVEIGYGHTKIPNDAEWEVVVYPLNQQEFVEFVEYWSHPKFQSKTLV